MKRNSKLFNDQDDDCLENWSFNKRGWLKIKKIKRGYNTNMKGREGRRCRRKRTQHCLLIRLLVIRQRRWLKIKAKD